MSDSHQYPVPYVSIVLSNLERKVLLVRGALPTRKVMGGENWIQACEKTALEIVGVRGEGERLLGVYTDVVDGEGRAIIAFEFETWAGKPIGEWFSEKGLPRNLSLADQSQIKDALSSRSEVFVR